MDGERFDRFVRSIGLASRRRLLGFVLAALVEMARPVTGVEGKRKPKRRRRDSKAAEKRGRNDTTSRGAARQSGGLAAEAKRKKRKKRKKKSNKRPPTVVASGGPRKVLVFLSGVCSFSADPLFNGLKSKLQRDYGYRDGEDFLSFSYTGGEASCEGWTQNSYGETVPAASAIAASVARLHAMLVDYLDLHHESRFVLVGHSLGGVVAFGEIVHAWGERSESDRVLDHLETVITVDSPLHGVDFATWAITQVPGLPSCYTEGQAVGDLLGLYFAPTATQHTIEFAIETAAEHGIKVVTAGNRLDCLFDASACWLFPGTGDVETQWARVEPAVTIERSFPTNSPWCVVPSPQCIDARHKAFLQEPEGIALLAAHILTQEDGATRTNHQCANGCVDPSTDPDNCAVCGHHCPERAICVEAQCRCPSGRILCEVADVCVDTMTDRDHCGGCGKYCAPPGTCEHGACVGSQSGSGYEIVAAWGSEGSSAGQFTFPSGIAIDAAGHIYISDKLNRRVQKFTSDGEFVTKWGTEGAGDGQFVAPQGIAVDQAGYIYVADWINERVQKFTSDGEFVTKWGTKGSGDGQFFIPWGIAVDGMGHVYVAESGNHRVQKFTADGRFLAKWGSFGEGKNQFRSALGVAVDAAGYVFVADFGNNRVHKFTGTGGIVKTWGAFGSGNGRFHGLTGIAVDRWGNVFTTEVVNNRIQRFTNNGEFFTTWGSRGSGPGQFDFPDDVAVDGNGNVYVVEENNHRVQKFSPGPGNPSS